MRTIFTLVLALLLAGPLSAQTVFKWVDEDGRIHYEHALPPDMADLAHERLYDGQVLERVDRAMTLEEREAAMAALAAGQSEDSTSRTRDTQDRLLLAAYSSEDEILATRESELTMIRSRVTSISSSMENALQQYHRIVAEAADLERAAKPVPETLAEQVREAYARVTDQQESMERIKRRIQRTEASFEEDLERFRELSGGGS